MGIVSAALGDGDSLAAGALEPKSAPIDCSAAGSEIAELACEWNHVGETPDLGAAASGDVPTTWVSNMVKVREDLEAHGIGWSRRTDCC